MTSQTNQILVPPSDSYDDQVLYGARREAIKALELAKLGNESECVIQAIGTYADKQKWTIKDLIGLDKRIKSMMTANNVTHAYSLQRYSWPHIDRSTFPVICVSPEGTGKTHTHLLYMVSRCITAIPISRTDEYIATADQGSSYLVASAANKVPNISKDIPIDQNNFDFDSLGKTPEPKGLQENSVDTGQAASTYSVDASEANSFANSQHIRVHPKYIVICSSHHQVESINDKIDRLKEEAYGKKAGHSKRSYLPPIVRKVNVHQDDEKLSIRCVESEILLGTPGALIKCFRAEYLSFSQCEKVFFDDIDLTLQLHNHSVRELSKLYLIQTLELESRESADSSCQMYLFSRKWTNLVKQFTSTLFSQKIIIFGSIVEASIYANLRFEIEVVGNNAKLKKLEDIVKLHLDSSDKMAIVCENDSIARTVSHELERIGARVKFLPQDTAVIILRARVIGNIPMPNIYVLSDGAIEYVADILNDVKNLVHFDAPSNIISFDQRFRLMYKHIQSMDRDLIATVFINDESKLDYVKELYDLVSRSNTTLKSTKLSLRDFISNEANTVCWRWATSGLCRLEKLSRDDQLGSYCPDRHSLPPASRPASDWPEEGQVRITVTHIISPNEFYFWFEAYRDIQSGKGWKCLNRTGGNYMSQIQDRLNQLKTTETCSIKLGGFKENKIYGVYFPELARVDRIRLIECVDHEGFTQIDRNRHLMSNFERIAQANQYSKLISAVKVDHGIKVRVYLRNVFELPEELEHIEIQCHRGFLLGVKPTDCEPDWLYKATKHFYDSISVNDIHEITAWLRLAHNNCFWFEHLSVSRRVSSYDESKVIATDPHLELCRIGYAEEISKELSFLNPSTRLETFSKWHMDRFEKMKQFAFIPKHIKMIPIFVLFVEDDLSLVVRLREYNKLLIRLEDELKDLYQRKKLVRQHHLAGGSFCLVRVSGLSNNDMKGSDCTINRCKIVKKIPSTTDMNSTEFSREKFLVDCLDHGDTQSVYKEDLYQIDPEYLARLPFQAIRSELADLDKSILKDENLTRKVQNLIYDLTRTSEDDLLPVYCMLKLADHYLYLFQRSEDNTLRPIVSILEEDNNLSIFTNDDQYIRQSMIPDFDEEGECNEQELNPIAVTVRGILLDLARRELVTFAAC